MGTWRTGAALGAVLALGAVGLAAPAQAGGGSDSGRNVVETRDECDPESFDRALGPGICDPDFDGGVEFEELVEELTEDPADVLRKRNAKGWTFSRDEMDIERHEEIHVVNTGGEAHTFTELPRYGAGCVPDLNAFFVGLPGFPASSAVRPPAYCFVGPFERFNFVGPGESVDVGGLSRGTHRFECVIHPWMRTTVHVH